MDTFPQQPQPSSPSDGFGEQANTTPPATPPPPQAPDVRLRTMESDIGSVEQSGGGEPTPQFITPPPASPDGAVVTGGPLPSPTGPSHELPPIEEGSGGRKAIVWLAGLVVIVGFAWILYVYGWPMLMQQNPVVTTAPIPTIEQPPQQPIPPPAPAAPAVSPFGTSFDSLPAVTISDYTIVSILAALQNESNKKPAEGNFKEVKIVDAQGPVAFSKYISTLAPEANGNGLAETLKTIFEDNFGAYIFYDQNGAWPGYVVKMKPGASVDMVTLTDRLQKIESSSYSNFFITPPGTTQGFRTGQVDGRYIDRFAPLSQAGASFNYGVFDQYLIINTSYNGLLKALELLGL